MDIKELDLILTRAQLGECEQLLKHATDLIDRLPENQETRWVIDNTNQYFHRSMIGIDGAGKPVAIDLSDTKKEKQTCQ